MLARLHDMQCSQCQRTVGNLFFLFWRWVADYSFRSLLLRIVKSGFDYHKMIQPKIFTKLGRNSKDFGNQSNIGIMLTTESKCTWRKPLLTGFLTTEIYNFDSFIIILFQNWFECQLRDKLWDFTFYDLRSIQWDPTSVIVTPLIIYYVSEYCRYIIKS